MFSEPRATKYAPYGALSTIRIIEKRDTDSPLVLAVLGDRSFQNLILGVLERRICKQQERIGPDMEILPSRHLNDLGEQLRVGGLKMDAPPLMIMRTITHSVGTALDKNGGKEEGTATWWSREHHVRCGRYCVT